MREKLNIELDLLNVIVKAFRNNYKLKEIIKIYYKVRKTAIVHFDDEIKTGHLSITFVYKGVVLIYLSLGPFSNL